MRFLNEDNREKQGRAIIDYKGYEIVYYTDGDIYVCLDGKELGTPLFWKKDKDYVKDDIGKVIKWIDEDIRCRNGKIK